MWREIVLLIYLGALSVFDMKSRSVPVKWLAAGIVPAAIGIAARLAAGEEGILACAVGLVPGIVLLAAGSLTDRMGKGDGCTLLITGCLLNTKLCLSAFAVSLLLAGVWAALLLIFRRAGRNARIPYIPFLLAAVICMRSFS